MKLHFLTREFIPHNKSFRTSAVHIKGMLTGHINVMEQDKANRNVMLYV